MKLSIKYYLRKAIGRFWDHPDIPRGKTVGYSFVRSEKTNVELALNTKVYPPFNLHDVCVGDYSYIAKNAQINNCVIGKFCSIGPNFCCGLGIHPTQGISTSPMFYSTAKQNGTTLSKYNKVAESKKTSIGNDVFIGANVTVLDGVAIGDGAVIGAGAVVTRDILPYSIASGVPATVKRFRFSSEIIQKLQQKKWWDGSEEELRKVERYLFDVEKYLDEY